MMFVDHEDLTTLLKKFEVVNVVDILFVFHFLSLQLKFRLYCFIIKVN